MSDAHRRLNRLFVIVALLATGLPSWELVIEATQFNLQGCEMLGRVDEPDGSFRIGSREGSFFECAAVPVIGYHFLPILPRSNFTAAIIWVLVLASTTLLSWGLLHGALGVFVWVAQGLAGGKEE